MRKWITRVCVAALAVALMGTVPAAAEVGSGSAATSGVGPVSGAGARGVVTDTAGHPLEAAQVEVYRLGTGLQTVLTTNGRGEFTLDGPVPDSTLWQLRVAAPGFRTVETGWINLARQRYQPLRVEPLYGSVKVAVRDSRGASVGGTVLLVGPAGQLVAQAPLEQSAFERSGLAAGEYRLIVMANGFMPQALTVTVTAGRSVPVLVTLEKAGIRAAGEVRDAVTGVPVEGARVEFVQGDRVPAGSGATVAGGRFAFSLPQGAAGEYRVRVSAPGYRTAVTAPAALAGGQAHDWSGGEAVRLQPLTGSWAGVVLSRYGEPLMNTPVVLQLQGYGEVARTETSQNGEFRFEGLAAGPGLLYRLSAEKASDPTDTPWTEMAPGVVNQAVLQGRAGSSQVYDTAQVSGLVLDPAGAPLASVKVELLRGGSVAKTGTTGADGSFLLTDVPATQQGWGQANPYAVRFSKDGYLATREFSSGGKAGTDLAVPAQSRTVATAVLRPAAPALTGRVAGSDGTPVAGAEVRFVTEGSPEDSGLTAKADDQGIYRLNAVPLVPGRRYTLRVQATGFTPVTGVDVTDAVTTTGSLPTVTLAPAGAAFAGQVLGPDGRGVAGADLILRGPAGETLAKAASDGTGYYRLDAPASAPADGLLTLTAARSGWSQALAEFARMPAPGSPAVTDLVLVPGTAGIEGRVMDDQGNPVFARIDLVQEGRGVILTAETDLTGYYQFSDVPLEGSGWYWLRASAPGRTLAGSLTHQTEMVPMLRLSPGERTVVDLLMN